MPETTETRVFTVRRMALAATTTEDENGNTITTVARVPDVATVLGESLAGKRYDVIEVAPRRFIVSVEATTAEWEAHAAEYHGPPALPSETVGTMLTRLPVQAQTAISAKVGVQLGGGRVVRD